MEILYAHPFRHRESFQGYIVFFLEMYLNGVGYFLEFIFFIPENKFDNNEICIHEFKNSNFKNN